MREEKEVWRRVGEREREREGSAIKAKSTKTFHDWLLQHCQ